MFRLDNAILTYSEFLSLISLEDDILVRNANELYKEKYIDFEAKSCRELNFSFDRIYEHQIKHLDSIDKLGGIAFLIIEFSSIDEVYILPSKLLIEKYNESLNGGRKSIPYSFFNENGFKIKYQRIGCPSILVR